MSLKHIAFSALIVALAAGVAGWSTPSEAKHKMAAAPKPEPLRFCTGFEDKPVCGMINGARQTFGSECWAKQQGAKIMAQGACKPPKAHKMAAKKPMKMPMKKM